MDFNAMKELSLVQLAVEMRRVSDELEAVNDRKKDLQKDYDTLRRTLIPEAMDDDGVRSLTVDGVGQIQLRSDVFASIAAEHKQEAFDWLTGTGHGGLIKEAVHTGTLKALMKELIKTGVELPPESCIKVTPYTQAVLVKSRG